MSLWSWFNQAVDHALGIHTQEPDKPNTIAQNVSPTMTESLQQLRPDAALIKMAADRKING